MDGSVRMCMQAYMGQKKSNRLHDTVVILRQYATRVSQCLHSEGCGAELYINPPAPKPHACDYSCHLKCMTRDHCFLILSGLFRRLKCCPRAPLERRLGPSLQDFPSNMLNEVLFICRAIGRAPSPPRPPTPSSAFLRLCFCDLRGSVQN